jgi:hypothetical protein
MPGATADSAASRARTFRDTPLHATLQAMMNRIMIALTTVVLLGCDGDSGGFGPEDDQFVETMVALRRASVDAGRDTAAFEAAKTALLEERGLTEDSLRAYVERRSSDLQAMAAIWDSVNARLMLRPEP